MQAFERVLGRAQHCTIGPEYLTDSPVDGEGTKYKCTFRASCDKGMTWPEEIDPDGTMGTKCKARAHREGERADGGTR